VKGVVKWFDPLKGFGFVAVEGGGEAFLHVSRLKAGGHSDNLPEGSRITVRLGPGKKGAEVTEVVDISPPGSETTDQAQPYPRPRPSDVRESDAREEELVGFVKWYNPNKGFGFVAVGEGRKDVFVAARTLNRSGLTDLAEGKRVRVKVVEGHKGPEARSIELLD
jgi:CspA family cold shock protein